MIVGEGCEKIYVFKVAVSSVCNVIKKWQFTGLVEVKERWEDHEKHPREQLRLLEDQIKTSKQADETYSVVVMFYWLCSLQNELLLVLSFVPFSYFGSPKEENKTITLLQILKHVSSLT